MRSSDTPSLTPPLGSGPVRAVKFSLAATSIAIAVVLLAAVVLAFWLAGAPGLRAVALCAVAGAVLVAVTFATHIFTMKNPDLMMASMGADFVLKLLVIIVSVVVARRIEGLDAYTLFFTMLAIIMTQTVVFPLALTRARIPVVNDPEE